MEALLQDKHLVDRPSSSYPRKAGSPVVKKRPASASAGWHNPNSLPKAPTKKFLVSLNAKPFESRVSKKAPFAARALEGKTSFDQPKVVNGKVLAFPEYNPLEDPHLSDFYARKLGLKPGLNATTKQKLKEQKPKSARVVYQVTVNTADKKNAQTNARVFVMLRGTKGKLTRQQLVRPEEPVPFVFARGSSETFNIRAPDIGQLIAVEIDHDGVERNQSWFLESVVVKQQKTKKTWALPCQQTLSMYEGDCQVKRLLKVTAEDEKPERVIYEVEVITSDVRGAGTDAHVFISMHGDRGDAQRVQLVNRNINTFERGQTDLFKIKVRYLGKLKRLQIEHDNEGFAPGWHLDKVVVTNAQDRKEKWYFPCNKWLSDSEDDKQISRLLTATSGASDVAQEHKYKISTHTGDIRGAGTDANVFITLFSKEGSSPEIKLNDSANNFERNKTDTFDVACPSLGALTRARIRHDDSGVAAGWFLAKVVAVDEAGGVYTFACQRWLSTSEDDGQISRELALEGGAEFSAGIPYNLSITTGDVRYAGTSAKVYVILYAAPEKAAGKGGKQGTVERDSGKLWVRNGKSDNFERGRTDLFTVECTEELAPIDRVTIGHDNSGSGSAWFMERVVVESPSAGLEQTFFCRQWFADDEGDHKIERDLVEDLDYRKKREAKAVCNVAVYTSDIRSAGTDANVAFVLYGENGKTEEVKLDNTSNNFERAAVDKFKLDIKDVGKPYKLRVWHDNSRPFADWHLDRVEFENNQSRARHTFRCDRWIGTSEDDGQLIRELPASGDGIEPRPVLQYPVKVQTGEKWGAGTDANVFLNIYGEFGDTGERPLTKSQNVNKFEKAQLDEFTVEAVSLGALSSVRVGHDGKGSSDGWFLNKIIVTDPSTGTDYPFICERWLATNEDDGLIIRELPVGDRATLLKTTSYHVTVRTGDVRGAGTNANVYIILIGDTGDTGKLALRQAENTKDKFERGRADQFKVEAMDIGKISKLVIGHDGSGVGSGWFVDSVLVDVPSRGTQVRFACNKWLDKGEDDGLIERELYPSEETELSKKVPHEVEVHTSDIRGAGTDAGVFIVLYGTEGKSEEFWLRNKTDNFERAQVDRFKIEVDEIGTITKMRVGHNNAGMGAAWHLDKIVIQRLKPPAKKKNKKKKDSAEDTKSEDGEIPDVEDEDCFYAFPCDRWFSKNEDDGEIIRELVAYDKSGTRPRAGSLAASTYVMRVFTGDASGCGTNANVFATLYGENGDSGERQLKKSETHMDKFERNQEDVFKLEAMSLGKISKLKIRHDNSGVKASWLLDKIEVLDETNSEEYIFPCNQWLSKAEGDGAISRELLPVDRAEFERRRERSQRLSRAGSKKSLACVDLEQATEKTTYNISVETGDERGCGTNANVYIYIYGENEDSGKIDLKTSKTYTDKFERAHTDEFTAEAIQLGEIKKIRIGHDNSGVSSGWYLDNIVVDVPSEGRKYIFQAGRWLDKDKDDGMIEAELYPAKDKVEEYKAKVAYEFVVYTSDLSGAGTDANVYVALYGSGGTVGGLREAQCTEDCPLTPKKDCFDRGSVDIFVKELEDVGEQIEKLRVGHDNKGLGSDWHLDKVEVRRMTTTESGGKGSTTFTFTCGKWLAKGKEDGAIVRELVPSKIVEEGVDKKGKLSVIEHRVDALEAHQYKVHVFTGDVKKAGTDANVFVTLYGENGDSGERQLMKSETNTDKFERAKEDIFAVEAVELGFVRKVMIRHDDANIGSDWYLDRVEVVDSTDGGKKYVFPCERWLAKKKEDGKIKRSLYEKTYEGDRSSTATSAMGSTASFDGSVRRGSSFSLNRSPTLSRKASFSGRSESADKVFDEQYGKALKKSASKRSLLSKASSLGSLKETIPYTVRVATGEESDHGTTANVYTVLIGAEGASEKIPLELIGKTEGFERGAVDTFSVEAPEYGEIKKIELGHDGYRANESWYVKHVEVDVPTTGRKYFFPCECWLGKDKEDGKTSRIFSVDEAKEIAYKPKVAWEVSVYTGDVQNSGTDSIISLVLIGPQGSSEKTVLEKQEERFERNSVDVMHLNLDDVGQPSKLRIGHNGKGSRSSWFLDKVVFRNMDTDEVTIFKCERWFSKTEDPDGLLTRELPASVDGKQVVEETTYTVTVTTGDLSGCGTDANVFLIMFGSAGDSEELSLKESTTNSDKFERAQTDVFEFKMLSLGTLHKVRIWHDNKFPRAGWFLDRVEVQDGATKTDYMFPCQRWLARDEDDKQLVRELSCGPTKALAKKSIKDDMSVTGYELTFHTDEDEKAGTLHNVEVVLVDEEGGKSKPMLIENSPKKKLFRSGQIDTTTVVTAPLSPLTSMTLTHVRRDGIAVKGTGKKWRLLKVVAKDLTDNESYTFTSEYGIPLSTENKKLPVELACTDTTRKEPVAVKELKPVQYTVNVHTADVKSAGTDANVSMIMYGENGDTGRRELTKKFKDLFERGHLDDFKIEALDLGKLTKLHIEHDNKGFGAGWMLDRVEVVNGDDQSVTAFPCQQWLDKKKGDKLLARDLFPAS